MKSNGIHQRLVYADYINILGASVHSITQNTKRKVFANKEIGLEENADQTKCMIMSRDQNKGRSHSMKSDTKSFERVEVFKYLGTTLTNQNSIRKKLRAD